MTEEEIKWNSLDKIIVEKLCAENAVNCFEIYTQLGFSPVSIASTARKLGRAGLAVRKGDQIQRTPEFFEQLFLQRHSIYNREMPWKYVYTNQDRRHDEDISGQKRD